MTIIRLPTPAAPAGPMLSYPELVPRRRRLRGRIIVPPHGRGSPYPPGFDALQVDGETLTLDGEDLIIGTG